MEKKYLFNYIKPKEEINQEKILKNEKIEMPHGNYKIGIFNNEDKQKNIPIDSEMDKIDDEIIIKPNINLNKDLNFENKINIEESKKNNNNIKRINNMQYPKQSYNLLRKIQDNKNIPINLRNKRINQNDITSNIRNKSFLKKTNNNLYNKKYSPNDSFSNKF